MNCIRDRTPCNIKYFNGDQDITATVTKPILEFSNLNITSVPFDPSQETITMCVDVTNIGDTLVFGDPITVNYYADVNQNGVQDLPDILLDSATWTFGLNPGDTINLCKTVNVSALQSCNFIAKLSNTTCACSQPEVRNLQAPAIIAAGADQTSCSKGTVTIGSTAITGYTYTWTPTIGLVDPNSAATVVNLPINTSDKNDTLVYVLNTQRTQGCESDDTVLVIVRPQPVVTATPLNDTICSGPPPFTVTLFSLNY